MSGRDLCVTTATDLVSLYRKKQVSPLEVTRAVLAQIERVNPELNAYGTVRAAAAFEQAAPWAHWRPRVV